MKCSGCGRELKHGEVFCLNCGEPTASAVDRKIREKPSDIISCLVIGLFVLFGVPALVFGSYLLAYGAGLFSDKPPPNGLTAMLISIIPLGVFLTLASFLFRIWRGNRD